MAFNYGSDEEEAELNGYLDEEDEDSEFDDSEGDEFDKASSVAFLPVATVYVDNRLRREASNRFTFDVDAKHAVRFLASLPEISRQQIKDLGFTRTSTAADDADCTQHWQELCDFISGHMQLASVTIQIPRDTTHPIDKSKEVQQPPDSEWFWWPAVKGLTKILMEGKIQTLRLGYSATLINFNFDDTGDSDIPLNDLSAIEILRYNHPEEEQRRESDEFTEYRAAAKNGLSRKFNPISALMEDQLKRRQRLDFVVSREDNPVGDVGTVLILTRPSHDVEKGAPAPNAKIPDPASRRAKPSPKPPSSACTGSAKPSRKRASRALLPKQEAEEELLDKEGYVIAGSSEQPEVKGKRKREHDHAYRPKGGSSKSRDKPTLW